MDIQRIQRFIRQGKYRIKSHAVMHMVKEGFDERDCIIALLNGRILEEYPEVKRCLVVGTFQLTPKTKCPLHIVCDLSQPDRVEIVTAYIPQPPDWVTPTQRGRRKR